MAGSEVLHGLLRRLGHNEPWDRIAHVEAVRGHFYRGVKKGLWAKVVVVVHDNAGVFTPDHVRGFEAIAQAEGELVRLKGSRA